MLNFSLAREIYGMSPWYVDQETLPSLLSILDNKIQLENPEVKCNTPGIFMLNDTRIIDRPYGNDWVKGQLENQDKFTGIGVINLNGPITLSGGASSIGMEQLSLLMLKMAADSRIVSFIVLSNSGGGSASAVEVMADTISQVNKIKPVYGLIKKGGIAASACYGILSACRNIYAESEMSLVGSAGTMIQFEGRAANSEDSDGKKYKRLYATKSVAKNIEFEEALNNDNYKLIINNLLDPMNENFLNLIQTNRPVLKGTDYDSGKAVFAKDAVGSFIDGIKSMAEVVDMIESEIKEMPTPAGKGINPINNHVMTVEQLKQDHPETYNAIFNAGVKTEASRTQAWMAHADADLGKVQEGIKSGEEISSGDREELMIKAYKQNHIQKIETDSAAPVNTPESGSRPEKAEDDELAQFNAKIDEQLKA